MLAFTDEEVLQRVSELPTFTGWPNGVLDVWIRSTADDLDAFDDKAFTYECFGATKKPKFIMARNGTRQRLILHKSVLSIRIRRNAKAAREELKKL